jgi:hypothetical protein
VLGTRHPELLRKRIAPQVEIAGNADIQAPAPVLRTVFCNLLDRAIANVVDGKITVSLDANGVTVTETGAHESDAIQADCGSDQRMTHGIVDRLCEKYGWRVESSARSDHERQARLLFSH